MIINAIIEKDKDGYFAFVPELKGCVSQGNSFEEAKANIKEAIEGCLSVDIEKYSKKNYE